MKRSSPGGNAFSVLMSSGKKKKAGTSSTSPPKTPSRFILCPAGCGKHVASIDVNNHLDLCLQQQAGGAISEANSTREEDQNTAPKEPTIITVDTSKKGSIEITNKDVKKPPEKNAVQPNKVENNAFAHMMKRSSEVFSTPPEPPKLWQRFHLCGNGDVTLTCYGGLSEPTDLTSSSFSPPTEHDVVWEETVQLKNRNGLQKERPPQTIQLVLSSSIPSAAENAKNRLVQRHSRLSVPVLKSILQKSIRRRRPLPSVRVAMELADKSLGDLLRRLPIIVFEDSSLHPDFSFLLWLMVADTKNFVLPPNIMAKLMKIVFEIASCPFQDDETCVDNEKQTSEGEDAAKEEAPSLSSFHKPGIDAKLNTSEILIWSALLRAQYGGMRFDVKMLRAYAGCWSRRFSIGAIPSNLASRLPVSASPSTKNAVEIAPTSGTSCCKWRDVPNRIHLAGRKQSSQRVSEILKSGIAKLVPSDLCVEGVDFHCSNVLDTMLSDQELVNSCLDQLKSIVDNEHATGLGQIPSNHEEKRAWLEGVLKKCMWHYSSGVNFRRPLQAVSPELSDVDKSTAREEDSLKTFWNELVAVRAKSFMKKYIEIRVAA